MDKPTDTRIGSIRSFNRFYTNFLGLLNRRLLESDFTLVEARIMFELGRMENATASELNSAINIDTGYMSRLLSKFSNEGIIKKLKSSDDSRKWLISLTSKGHESLSSLHKLANEQINSILFNLTEREQKEILASMTNIKEILGAKTSQMKIWTLRTHQPGDIGYLSYLHGALYNKEYGFNSVFESYCTEGLNKFFYNADNKREKLWVADLESEVVGCVSVIETAKDTAQLRWLVLHPKARGFGLGRKMVQVVINFSREHGYSKVFLWTVNILVEARGIYVGEGFQLTEEKPSSAWGVDLIEERWDLELK